MFVELMPLLQERTLLITVARVDEMLRVNVIPAKVKEGEDHALTTPLSFTGVPLLWPCWNEPYELLMAETYARVVEAGIEEIAFGDLFLEDVRTYREKQLRDTGLLPIFPLWGRPTRDLAKQMIASGIRAKLTCVATQKLDGSFVGQEFDEHLLAALPDGVDPCGENGEFHSFVYAGQC